MTFVWRATLVVGVIFAGCMVGVLSQHLLPAQQIADAKSAITTIQGLVGLLLALVLGLRVWTSYAVHSTDFSLRCPPGSRAAAKPRRRSAWLQFFPLDACQRSFANSRCEPRHCAARGSCLTPDRLGRAVLIEG